MLSRHLQKLRKLHGTPTRPPISDAFALYLWDRVGYLFDDARRLEAFELLRARVGLTPKDVVAAKPALLLEIASHGGIEGHKRATHMRDAAEYVLVSCGGDLDGAIRAARRLEAMRILKRLPMTADAGAARILMLSGAHPVFALESNSLRVLVRLGFGHEEKSYDKTQRSALEAVAPAVKGKNAEWLADAHLLLRQHGKTFCKTSAPLCGGCVLRADCAFAR